MDPIKEDIMAHFGLPVSSGFETNQKLRTLQPIFGRLACMRWSAVIKCTIAVADRGER